MAAPGGRGPRGACTALLAVPAASSALLAGLLVVLAALGPGPGTLRGAAPTCAAGPPSQPAVRPHAEVFSYTGRPGTVTQTLAGAVHHGMEDVEVWAQTFAPGAGTPVHRHDCEEVFLVTRGTATLRVLLGPQQLPPGAGAAEPRELVAPANATIVVPKNAVHQLVNAGDGDLSVYVIVGSPPIEVYTFPSWAAAAEDRAVGSLVFPYHWDRACPPSGPSSVR